MTISLTVYEIFSVKNSLTLKTGLVVVEGIETVVVQYTIYDFLLDLVRHQAGTIRKLGCGFLFAFHSNYGSILHSLQDKTRYWLKIVILSFPPLHSMPLLVVPRRNIAIPIWWG